MDVLSKVGFEMIIWLYYSWEEKYGGYIYIRGGEGEVGYGVWWGSKIFI